MAAKKWLDGGFMVGYGKRTRRGRGGEGGGGINDVGLGLLDFIFKRFLKF